MNTANTTTSNNVNENLSLTNQRIYKLRNFYRYLGPATGVGMLILSMILTSIKQNYHPSISSILLIFLLSLVLGTMLTLIIHFLLRKLRLITSDEGIVFYGQGGYRLYTPWDNIKGRTLWATGRGSTEAIALSVPAKELSITEGIQQRQPAIEKHGWITRMDTMHQTSNVIPVGYFMGDWQSSSLALDLKQHVPGVFEQKRFTKR